MSSHHSQSEEQVASHPGLGSFTYVLSHTGQLWSSFWLERPDELTDPGPRMHCLHWVICSFYRVTKITKYCLPPPHPCTSFCTKSPLRQISKQGKGTYDPRVGSETRRKGTFLSGGCVPHLTLNIMSSQRPNEKYYVSRVIVLKRLPPLTF